MVGRKHTKTTRKSVQYRESLREIFENGVSHIVIPFIGILRHRSTNHRMVILLVCSKLFQKNDATVKGCRVIDPPT